ncbi:hypothetical protein HOT81_gp037 [Gordonia phage Fryberger]|uniref:Uncharacterized protein n=1 Tax=Gordonia phage Fryberger TaxID=2250392 RepID=A0A346FCJ1_9CAUD|nr:hypothetical protein HOT81_gp037 [Gordonia phage Fryberger]AXN53455.1 hypothetical protein SEA_FRYBERGER_37 [Gordonia phage Fryberger]QTF81827.1 hypothetical protein SEA_GUEY18_42 [Gordonia phage Guey18]
MNALKPWHGWAFIAGTVVLFETLCAKEPVPQYLTHGYWRFKQQHPLLAYSIVAVTGLHLLGHMPPKLDPYHLTILACTGAGKYWATRKTKTSAV